MLQGNLSQVDTSTITGSFTLLSESRLEIWKWRTDFLFWLFLFPRWSPTLMRKSHFTIILSIRLFVCMSYLYKILKNLFAPFFNSELRNKGVEAVLMFQPHHLNELQALLITNFLWGHRWELELIIYSSEGGWFNPGFSSLHVQLGLKPRLPNWHIPLFAQ